jgi:hypothetical protein
VGAANATRHHRTDCRSEEAALGSATWLQLRVCSARQKKLPDMGCWSEARDFKIHVGLLTQTANMQQVEHSPMIGFAAFAEAVQVVCNAARWLVLSAPVGENAFTSPGESGRSVKNPTCLPRAEAERRPQNALQRFI